MAKKKPKKNNELLEALININVALKGIQEKLDAKQAKEVEAPVEKPKKSSKVIERVVTNDNPFTSKPVGTPTTISQHTSKTAATKTGKKPRYELLSYDEYNQSSIVMSSGDLNKVFTAARSFVTEANVNNALALGEKDKSWEAYFPIVVDGEGNPIDDILYAGNKRNGKHYIYINGENGWEQAEANGVNVRHFLGEIANGRTRSDWYLTDHRGKQISTLTDPLLDRKTVLFVKVA